MSLYESASATAKRIRLALKEAFPDLGARHFKVTSDTFSGGSSVSVHYEDYPTVKEVNDVTQRFKSNSYDGMNDMEEHHGYDELGFNVSGAGYISVTKNTSAKKQKLIDDIVANKKAKGYIPNESDHQDDYRQNRKVDELLNRDLFYMGDRRDIEGVTNEDLLNLTGNTKLYKEDFTSRVKKIKDRIKEEYIYSKPDDEATDVKLLSEIDNTVDKLVAQELAVMKFGEEVTNDKRVDILLSFEDNIVKRYMVNNKDLSVKDVAIMDGIIDIKPIRNEILSGVAELLLKYQEAGFKVKNVPKLLKPYFDMKKLEDLKIPDYDLERIPVSQVVSICKAEADNLVMLDIENGITKVTLTKEEETIFGLAFKSLVPRDIEFTQDEIKEVIKEVIVKKGELGLNFKANFKDVVSEIVSRHLDGRLEATFSQEQKEVYQNADVESKIESILDRAETRGFIINKSTFDITFQNELAKKVRWEKDYRDKAKYPDYRAFSDGAIDKIISESAIRSIDRTVFTSDEKEAIKNLVDNGLQPHLQSLISNNTEDFVRKNIKEELTKLEKNKEIRLLKSDVENHVETFLNTYVEEINKIIRNEVRYNLRGGSEEYDANMTGKGAEYLEMADTLDSVVDKYSQVRETAKELNDRKPEYKEMVKDVSTDSYESIANYNYQYSKGNITREEYINKTDEIINNAIEDIKDIENYKQPNEKVNKVLEENRILVESVVNERQALGFEFKDVAVVDAVLKSYFPNVINEQELTRESVLEKLARLGYRTHLTQLDLEVIIEKLQEEIRQSYSKELVERLAKSGEEANLYNEIVLEYGGEIANQKHVQKTQNANTEAVKEYIFQNLENMVDRKLSKFIGNIQVQEENKISKIEKEEVERFKASYMEKTNLDGSFFDDIDNIENTMLTLNDFIQSGKGTDKTIRTAIVKSLRKDVENLGVIEYRLTAEEMRAIHDRLAMDSYTHLASDEYFEKMVSVLDGKEYPMEDIFTFLNANSSNNGYYLDKVGRISDIQNWLQITGVYKNLLKFAKPLIDESDVGGLSDKALVVRYIKDATESLVKLTRTKVAGSKYLKEKDIVEILVGQSKDEYRNLVIAFGKKVESYNEDMTSDVKEISLDTHRLITEARDMEEDLADKTAVVLTEALSNQLSDAKKSAIVRENTQKLDKQIIDYIKDRLKMYSLNYQGNLTMENLIKINSGFEAMRQEYATAISENKTATELEELFVGFKQRIVDILNTILITMAEENTRVGQYGLVISKNGLSVKEKSNAVRITRSLFKLNPDGNENYPTEIAFGGKNYAVTLNHYILGIKAFNGDLGKYLMHNSVISNVYNISTEDVEEGRLTNNTEFVKIILNKIAGEIAGEGKLNDVISEQLVFKEISNNPSQDANSIFEEALENTIAKISEKKGIVFNKDYVLSNYKDNFNEIVLAIGTQLARINRVTKGDRKAIINFAEENITQTLTSLQTDLNSFELTFTEREMTEIRTRLNGTLSRYKNDKKLTNSFKETVITAWNNNAVPKDVIPKKANETFSDNLVKLREERTIKGIIERFIQTEREKGSVVYSVDVSPTMNKASIDGLTDRQLASKFSNAIQNIVANSNVDFTMADHQVLYSKLVVKDSVIDLCNRVNVRLFNHRVNQDENVDINSIINQEMASTEQSFKESDVFKDLVKEIEAEQNGTVEDVIFNGLNISEMIRQLKESELEIATNQTNKNVWGRYLLSSQSYKTELEIRQAIMSGTISVIDAVTGNRTYLITQDIIGYREQDGTLVKAENVNEQELKTISTNISSENMISRLQNGVARIVFQKVGNGEKRVMFATRNPEVIEHYANLHSIKLTDKNGNKDRRFEQLNQDSIGQQLSGDYITVFSLDSKGFRTFKPTTLYDYDEEYNVPSFISFSKDFDTWEQTMEGNIPVFELNVDNQYIADELGEAVTLRTNEVVANEVFQAEQEEILREEEQYDYYEEEQEREREEEHSELDGYALYQEAVDYEEANTPNGITSTKRYIYLQKRVVEEFYKARKQEYSQMPIFKEIFNHEDFKKANELLGDDFLKLVNQIYTTDKMRADQIVQVIEDFKELDYAKKEYEEKLIEANTDVEFSHMTVNEKQGKLLAERIKDLYKTQFQDLVTNGKITQFPESEVTNEIFKYLQQNMPKFNTLLLLMEYGVFADIVDVTYDVTESYPVYDFALDYLITNYAKEDDGIINDNYLDVLANSVRAKFSMEVYSSPVLVSNISTDAIGESYDRAKESLKAYIRTKYNTDEFSVDKRTENVSTLMADSNVKDILLLSLYNNLKPRANVVTTKVQQESIDRIVDELTKLHLSSMKEKRESGENVVLQKDTPEFRNKVEEILEAEVTNLDIIAKLEEIGYFDFDLVVDIYDIHQLRERFKQINTEPNYIYKDEVEIAHKYAKVLLRSSDILAEIMPQSYINKIEKRVKVELDDIFLLQNNLAEGVADLYLDGMSDEEAIQEFSKLKYEGSPLLYCALGLALANVLYVISKKTFKQGYNMDSIETYHMATVDIFIEKYRDINGRGLADFDSKANYTPEQIDLYNKIGRKFHPDLEGMKLLEYKFIEYLEAYGFEEEYENGLRLMAIEMFTNNKEEINQHIADYFNTLDNPNKDSEGFTPSENDVTYKNINVNELIHLIQNNTVTVKFRKKPTKKVPEGELRELTGTRNLELIKERITELEQEQQDKIITSVEKMNTKEFVAGELSKGTIGMFEYAINEGRQFTLARLISYQVEGGEEVVLEDVSEVIDNHTHFNPKAEETFVTKEDMYETLRNKVVRVTFEKADKNERVMYCTMNKDLLEKYFVRDLDKLKYNPDAEVKTSEENKAEQLDNGLFKVLDLEAQSFRSFKFDKVLPFNDLHKVSSWIEFEPEQMGWFEVLKGNANIKDLEDVGNRNAKETTTTLTTERTTLEAENNQNYVEANKILDSLEADYINRVRKESELRDKYSDNMARLDIALDRVKDAEDLIKEGKNVLKYNKQDLEIKAEQEARLLSMCNGLNNVKTESVKSMKAVIKPKSDKDMTTVLLVEYEIVEGGILYSGLEAVISNPRFLLNGVSYEVVADTTNSLHFGTGSVVKSPISAQLKKMMEVMAEKTFGNAKVQLSVLGSKLVDTDAKRLTRLHTLVQNNKDDLAKSKISITMHNATPDFPAHAKFETVDNGTKVVWQITPAYIYDEVNENILYVRQNPGSTSKEYEQYLENLARFLNSKPSKDKMKEAGIDLSSMQKLKILHALTSKAFNLRSAVK